MTTKTKIRNDLQDWYCRPIWQGCIYYSRTGSDIEIHNCVAGWRTSLTIPATDARRFCNFCSSTSFIFVLLNDDIILGLKEAYNGSFTFYGRWTPTGIEGGYDSIDFSSPDSIVVSTHPMETECCSHLGLSIEESGHYDKANIGWYDGVIGCTEKYLYVAAGQTRDKLCQINFSTFEMNDFSLPAATAIRRIECGYGHVVVLDSVGCVYTLGFSTRGELGHGGMEPQTAPKVVEALLGLRVRDISAGGWHTVAVTEFGDAYVWGWNNDGQLGYENVSTILEPQHLEFPGDVSVLSVSCGSRHSVFVTENDDVYGCGWNGYKQLGEQSERGTCGLVTIQYNNESASAVLAFAAGFCTRLLVQVTHHSNYAHFDYADCEFSS